MRTLQLSIVLVSLLLVTSFAEAGKHKKRKSNSESFPTKTKTKTKWSSSTDLGAHAQNSMVATEEHGYYVKRTFLPISGNQNATKMSPPFLAVPIAWFPCADTAECVKLNSMAINSNSNSLNEGFLCDDDCTGPYEPICGKTSTEVAVFYNKCKLNVAKCRSHGYWSDFAYEECKTQYPEEVKYAEMKFRANPYFKEKVVAQMENKPLVDLDDQKQVEATTIPVQPAVESVTEQKVLIKEIHQSEAEEKQQESKDRYEEIKKPKAVVRKL
ncbi:ecdysone-inducible gene L1 [Musca autumnalis]|uniref:ecdysone-inducible gene L1 n=1 Tax=Musca autumnalis TaxID=221902 RepID=UPI003CE6F7F2